VIEKQERERREREKKIKVDEELLAKNEHFEKAQEV